MHESRDYEVYHTILSTNLPSRNKRHGFLLFLPEDWSPSAAPPTRGASLTTANIGVRRFKCGSEGGACAIPGITTVNHAFLA